MEHPYLQCSLESEFHTRDPAFFRRPPQTQTGASITNRDSKPQKNEHTGHVMSLAFWGRLPSVNMEPSGSISKENSLQDP